MATETVKKLKQKVTEIKQERENLKQENVKLREKLTECRKELPAGWTEYDIEEELERAGEEYENKTAKELLKQIQNQDEHKIITKIIEEDE